MALIFEKPSTRTRVSFEVGMRQLGGEVVVLSARDMQMGRGETPKDTARVLSRYVDAIMLRTDDVRKIRELAEHATVPVINGLTDISHPCQIMADVMTFEEHRGPIAGQVVAWTGDGNNVAQSFIQAAARFGFTLRIATPKELAPPAALLDWARRAGREDRTDQRPAWRRCAGARCVVTDAWVSMSDEKEGRAPQRHNLLAPYQLNARAAGAGGAGCHRDALPAGASRRGDHRRGDGRPAKRGVRRGGEPAARAEGRAALGAGRGADAAGGGRRRVRTLATPPSRPI